MNKKIFIKLFKLATQGQFLYMDVRIIQNN